MQEFEVLSFDVYGTLIDWEAGILGALAPVFDARRITAGGEALLQAYAGLETDIESGPYRS